MMHEQPVKTWNEKKRYWKRLLKNIDVIQVNSTSKNLADPEELQALVSHKKRKVEKIEVESPSITEVHDEVTNSRKRLRRSTISGSDLLAVMTSDANKALGDVLIPLDTLLPKLMVNSPGKDSGELRELRNLKSPTQDLLRSIQKTNPAVVEVKEYLITVILY